MKKKVMIMINSLYGGGAERILQTILWHINREKYDITVYSMHREAIDDRVYPTDIRYKFVFNECQSGKRLCNPIRKLTRTLKGVVFCKFSPQIFYRLFFHETYDVEVAFIEGESTRIIAGSNDRKSRKYAWIHVDLEQIHWTEVAYRSQEEEKCCYEKFDKVFCVSESVKSSAEKLFSVIPRSVDVQHNPIDEIKILQAAQEPVEKNKLLNGGEIVFISVGRLVPQKGFDRLLKVVYRLKKEGYRFSVNILGEGKDRDALERYVKDNELDSYVSLLGFCSNPYPYIKNADVFISSSRTEGYSTVVCEAIILGVPVLATDCSGMSEIIGNSGCGIISENSEEGIYRMMKQILDDGSQLEKLREKTLEHRKIFQLKNRMKEIEGILDGTFD